MFSASDGPFWLTSIRLTRSLLSPVSRCTAGPDLRAEATRNRLAGCSAPTYGANFSDIVRTCHSVKRVLTCVSDQSRRVSPILIRQYPRRRSTYWTSVQLSLKVTSVSSPFTNTCVTLRNMNTAYPFCFDAESVRLCSPTEEGRHCCPCKIPNASEH